MKQKLPLPVLYQNMESWYVEDSEPLAIILQIDAMALYVRDFDKMSYEAARCCCDEMDFGNLFWFVPGIKELQAMLDYRDKIDQTARLIGADPLKNAIYWGSKKIDAETRLGLNLALEREEALNVCRGAYLRPFLRL